MLLLLDTAGLLLALLVWAFWTKIKSKVPKATSTRQDFSVDNLDPYPTAKIKGSPKYRITMSLKKLDQENWLTVDKNYKEEHEIRTGFLRNQRSMMVQCLPEAAKAAEEVFHEVTNFLCTRYPAMFEVRKSGASLTVKNKETGETFPMSQSSNRARPLEIASTLAMEDMTILLKNEEGDHYIAATASFFPIGWSADGVVGYTVSKMHAAVPKWQGQVGNTVNKFLTRLTHEKPMERASYFVQVTHPEESKESVFFQPEGIVHENLHPQPEDIIIRKERQTFKRLPNSGAIMFGVKTSLTPLPELPLDELENLVIELQSWPEDTAQYKGRDHWSGVVMSFWHARRGKICPSKQSAVPVANVMSGGIRELECPC